MNYFKDLNAENTLLKKYKNLSLRKKVEIIKEGKRIDKKYNLPYISHKDKREWRKINFNMV